MRPESSGKTLVLKAPPRAVLTFEDLRYRLTHGRGNKVEVITLSAPQKLLLVFRFVRLLIHSFRVHSSSLSYSLPPALTSLLIMPSRTLHVVDAYFDWFCRYFMVSAASSRLPWIF